MNMDTMNNAQLAIYIKYVIRPRGVIHFSTDCGAFARECDKIGLNVLAVDLNTENDALSSHVVSRDWRQLPICMEDLYPEPLNNIEEPLLILVTKIPTDGIYFTVNNMLANWTLHGNKLWIFNENMDRWIYDLSRMSYIVDVPATIHAIMNLGPELENNFNNVIFKRTY